MNNTDVHACDNIMHKSKSDTHEHPDTGPVIVVKISTKYFNIMPFLSDMTAHEVVPIDQVIFCILIN